VHLGQDDLTAAAARAIVGPGAVLGLSTHTEPQIAAAVLQPVTYVAVGPVFGTSTKATGYEAVGLDRVRYAAAQLATKPLVAIGGITLDRAVDVIDAGATSVAVITDLIASGDPEARVRAYVARLARTGKV
jgi:thiamine-phosphate pyrophosphorylase